MSKKIRLEITFWLVTAFLMGLLVKDAFSSSQGSWLAGCLLLIPTLTLQKGIAWAWNFSGIKRLARLFLVGVSSLYLAYLAIAFVYWYFLGFNSDYFEKSIINPVLLWVIMGFFTGLYFFLFRKKQESQSFPETISFYSNRKLVSLKPEDILFIESLSEYTSVQLQNGQSLKNGVKISEWTNRLPDFLRVHRSFLINPEYAIYKGQEIEINGDHIIPISRSYKELTKEYFLKNQTS
ncbi:MAG: LytTR family transcriptional regulator [Algoriphagus sp.]|uniref:LytR/AlgR family response regulator transcription factor n=1 Tax=Algoriphagus sp. TaxID=1872435 RepID=UPI00181FB878|nr:LytTR family DNA-binding domain-containing protein [Algoriphagus sp.]NVJ84659.1 LytTR family transcriptional regulator [Algoriphagus sp.]